MRGLRRQREERGAKQGVDHAAILVTGLTQRVTGLAQEVTGRAQEVT
jgi:hypothetical protein